MKNLLAAVILGMSPAIAQAGDPCPISVNIRDLGAPDWLDREALLDALQVQRSWIGITYGDRDLGIELTYIHPDSAAAKAGLQVGDMVSEINGVLTTDDAKRRAMFDALAPGDQINFIRVDQPPVSTTVGHTDPVPVGMANAFEQQDCRDATLRTVPEAERADILPMLFNDNRGFRCEDAHVALQTLGERYEINEVYFVRGSRRILMTMPYWGTSCINIDALDGANYTPSQLQAALDAVVNDYVQDRFENP